MNRIDGHALEGGEEALWLLVLLCCQRPADQATARGHGLWCWGGEGGIVSRINPLPGRGDKIYIASLLALPARIDIRTYPLEGPDERARAQHHHHCRDEEPPWPRPVAAASHVPSFPLAWMKRAAAAPPDRVPPAPLCSACCCVCARVD